MDPIVERLGRLWKSLEKEKKKKDYRMKTANMMVRGAMRMRGAIVIERISHEII
jgi:hypothetical protein